MKPGPTSKPSAVDAIAKAESCGTGAYIEVVTGRYEASPPSLKLHDSLDTLYSV